MKRLFILRHAKAVAADRRLGDHARALARRGVQDAARMGLYMAEHGLVPDLVVCSTSKRTVETWGEAARHWQPKPEVKFSDALYLAPWPALLAVLRGAEDGAANVALIGHNPGCENLAAALIRKGGTRAELKAAALMAEKFPTAALAVVTFETQHWNMVAPERGRLERFVRPKDLDADQPA